MLRWLIDLWPYLTAGALLILSVATAGHAIIYKRDSRSAVGWVGLIALAPLIGSLLYILLGVNRIRRRAMALRTPSDTDTAPSALPEQTCPPDALATHLPDAAHHLIDMARLNERLTQRPLLSGNHIEPLENGDEAYPAMLDAIHTAQHSLTLTTYIFDNDAIGARFIDALADATQRGVHVRVLIDAVGARYSLPPVTHRLRLRGVRVARFNPGYLLPLTTPYLNLRSHRKILIADGHTAFTGGLNIRAHHLIQTAGRHATRDTHFRVRGPVVHDLQAVFAEDWQFATGELLAGTPWFNASPPSGPTIARAIPDGPDLNQENMRMAFTAGLISARQSIHIMSPYFLPDSTLISALNTCAMRGVDVHIVMPQVNNLKLVAWACMAQLWQLLEWGCHVWFTPPPFDHSKLFVVDRQACLIGSANWDPRSLRLNFELGLECYDPTLSQTLATHIENRIAVARPITLDEVNRRSLPIKLRDGTARLFAPYL